MHRDLAVFPGVLILCTVLSFNLLGDVLRTALEPKISKVSLEDRR